jgi:hypothetical protein
MPVYRLYLLDPRTERIDGFEDIASGDDDDAVRLVVTGAYPAPAELWLGSRKVRRFEVGSVEIPAIPALPTLA